jgi:hypothetical protein
MSLCALQQPSSAFHLSDVQMQRRCCVWISQFGGIGAHFSKQWPDSVRPGTIRNDHHQQVLRST